MSRELLTHILNELNIINDSEGIAGWHLNGDVEPWGRTEFPGLMEEIEAELAKPEPEPIGFMRDDGDGWFEFSSHDDDGSFPVYIDPPCQQEPSLTKFKRGDRVRKCSGSQWQGRVVGEYSTTLTPEGYAVESESHPGSVQIYPAAALELVGE